MTFRTKWAKNPLNADTLAKFANEILIHVQNRLVFETQFFLWGCHTPSPHCGYGPAHIWCFNSHIQLSNQMLVILKCAKTRILTPQTQNKIIN